MRKLTLSILAGACAFVAIAPASATVLLEPINGPNLATQIHASKTDTQNNQMVVFGSTASGGQSADVTFTANTAVNITDNGGGFASIGDANAIPNFTQLVIDPTASNFNALQFSVQLVDAGYVFIDYMLAGSTTFMSALTGTNPFQQNGKTNADYQISGADFTSIRITTCTLAIDCTANAIELLGGTGTGTGIFLEKQNSITLTPPVTSPVPEPATWAMMLFGFGAMGASLRRSRRRKGDILQIA